MNPLSAAAADLGLGLGSPPSTPGVDTEDEKRRKQAQQDGNFGSVFSGGAIGDLFGPMK